MKFSEAPSGAGTLRKSRPEAAVPIEEETPSKAAPLEAVSGARGARARNCTPYAAGSRTTAARRAVTLPLIVTPSGGLDAATPLVSLVLLRRRRPPLSLSLAVPRGRLRTGLHLAACRPRVPPPVRSTAVRLPTPRPLKTTSTKRASHSPRRRRRAADVKRPETTPKTTKWGLSRMLAAPGVARETPCGTAAQPIGSVLGPDCVKF